MGGGPCRIIRDYHKLSCAICYSSEQTRRTSHAKWFAECILFHPNRMRIRHSSHSMLIHRERTTFTALLPGCPTSPTHCPNSPQRSRPSGRAVKHEPSLHLWLDVYQTKSLGKARMLQRVRETPYNDSGAYHSHNHFLEPGIWVPRHQATVTDKSLHLPPPTVKKAQHQAGLSGRQATPHLGTLCPPSPGAAQKAASWEWGSRGRL